MLYVMAMEMGMPVMQVAGLLDIHFAIHFLDFGAQILCLVFEIRGIKCSWLLPLDLEEFGFNIVAPFMFGSSELLRLFVVLYTFFVYV